MIESIIFIR